MKNTILLFTILTLGALISNAQDIIYKYDKTQVKSRILEVQKNEIKYKKFEFLDGPTYTMSKSEIYMIVYKNGQKELFEDEKPVANTNEIKSNSNQSATKTNKNTESNSNTKQSTPKNDRNEFESSENTVKKQSFFLYDLAVSLKNLSNYVIPYSVFSAETVIKDNIGFQSFASFSYVSIDGDLGFGGNIKSTSSANTFGFGAKYYFNKVVKIDPHKYHLYAGAVVGYTNTSTTVSSKSSYVPSTSGSTSDFGVFGQVGGRYYLNNRWGTKAELQIAQGGTNFLIGLSYRTKYKKSDE